MNLTKNKIIAAVAIVILALQVAYIFTVYRNQMAESASLDQKITLERQKLAALTAKLENLPKIKADIEKYNLEKTALVNQIPSSYSTAKDFANIIDIAQANRLFNIGVESQESDVEAFAEYNIIEKQYKLTYYSDYSQSQNFIKNLNRSYQTINLRALKMDNKPQKETEYVYVGGNINDLVETTLEFSLYINPAKPDEEIYDSGFNELSKAKMPFYNQEETENVPVANPENEIIPPQQDVTLPENTQQAAFRLYLADILNSGDNFQFVGPSPTGDAYTGLASDKETYITLNVREDSYEILIEDEEGRISQNSAIVRPPNINLFIDSDIGRVKEEMPNVHIYINNYTSRLLPVTLTGKNKDLIKIYNDQGAEVLPNQTNGKVKLIYQ